MFEVGFSEIVLILGLALLVLGPEKLPGLAEKVGRWTGRARAMARQLRTQLEHEVTMEELSRTRAAQSSQNTAQAEPQHTGEGHAPTAPEEVPPDAAVHAAHASNAASTAATEPTIEPSQASPAPKSAP